MRGGETPGWFARRGVRWQSTTVAVAVVALALVAGTLLLLTLLHSSLTVAQRATLTSQVDQAAAVLVAEGGPHALSPRAHDELVTSDGVVQIVDSAGNLAYSSRQIDRVLADLHPAPGQWLSEGESTGFLSSQESLAVATGVRAGGKDYVVLAVTSQAEQRHAIETTGTILLGAWPVLLILAGVTTWWLTGRALRPVEQIRSEVEGIEFTDLTRRVRPPDSHDEVAALAATMNEMLARLEASQATQRRFVSDASHELRSPLSTLAAGLEIGREDPRAWSEVRELMEGEVVRMRRLVDGLLLLARADDRGLVIQTQDVDLDDLIERECRRLGARAGRAGGEREVAVSLRAQPVRVTGDGDKLTQVVRNLIDNAERAAGSRVDVTLARVGDRAVVAIEDDGAGIQPADRGRIFDRFTRLDDSRTRASGGSGLGLAIVAEIVGAHGGTVRVLDAPAGGARFEVELPAQVEPDIEEASADAAEPCTDEATYRP
ncbi:MAG: HAMP domain-containing sensor histidine kinase [Micrococcales bacterium]|nr:HAMP domain-containing sensor histidine kinase [Micrococcales bacterium]